MSIIFLSVARLFCKWLNGVSFWSGPSITASYMELPGLLSKSTLRKGKDIILDIDIQGARQVKSKIPGRNRHFYYAALV